MFSLDVRRKRMRGEDEDDSVTEDGDGGGSCEDSSSSEEWLYGDDYDGNAFRKFMLHRLTYRFKGYDDSADLCAGQTPHWTQRHNPFLFRRDHRGRRFGKVKGKYRQYPKGWVDDFVSWTGLTAENYVDVVESADGSSCTLMKFFNRTSDHAENYLLRLFERLSFVCVGSDVSVVSYHDGSRVEFNCACIDGGCGLHSGGGKNSMVSLTLPISFTLTAGSEFATTANACCEAHRCLSYIVNMLSDGNTKCRQPAWFYEPLHWVSIACGFCEEDRRLLPAGQYFELLLASKYWDFYNLLQELARVDELYLLLPERIETIVRTDYPLFVRVYPDIVNISWPGLVDKYGFYKFTEIIESVVNVLPYAKHEQFLQEVMMDYIHIGCLQLLIRHYSDRENAIRESLGGKLGGDALECILQYSEAPSPKYRDVIATITPKTKSEDPLGLLEAAMRTASLLFRYKYRPVKIYF